MSNCQEGERIERFVGVTLASGYPEVEIGFQYELSADGLPWYVYLDEDLLGWYSNAEAVREELDGLDIRDELYQQCLAAVSEIEATLHPHGERREKQGVEADG
jgi:hypothetical protein